MTNKEIFEKIIRKEGEGTRIIQDGGTSEGEKFSITDIDAPGVAENLAQWWDELDSDVKLTEDSAREYLDETYPLAV